MNKIKLITLAFVLTISLIGFFAFDEPVNIVEAVVTSTSTPPPPTTPPPTTPPPTTPPPITETPTVTPTPCQEEMGCAGIVPTVTPSTSNSLTLLIVGLLLLIAYWFINTISTAPKKNQGRFRRC